MVVFQLRTLPCPSTKFAPEQILPIFFAVSLHINLWALPFFPGQFEDGCHQFLLLVPFPPCLHFSPISRSVQLPPNFYPTKVSLLELCVPPHYYFCLISRLAIPHGFPTPSWLTFQHESSSIFRIPVFPIAIDYEVPWVPFLSSFSPFILGIPLAFFLFYAGSFRMHVKGRPVFIVTFLIRSFSIPLHDGSTPTPVFFFFPFL